MTDPNRTETLYVSGQTITVSTDIPVPKTAADVANIKTLSSSARDADLLLSAAEQRMTTAAFTDAQRIADEFAKDPTVTPTNLTEEQDAAQDALNAATALRLGVYQAIDAAYRTLQDDFGQERPQYAKALIARIPASLTKLTTAIKMAQQAQAELTDLDMLESVRRNNLSPLGRPGGFGVYLPDGLMKLQQALSVAVDHFEQLKQADYTQPQQPIDNLIDLKDDEDRDPLGEMDTVI